MDQPKSIFEVRLRGKHIVAIIVPLVLIAWWIVDSVSKGIGQ